MQSRSKRSERFPGAVNTAYKRVDGVMDSVWMPDLDTGSTIPPAALVRVLQHVDIRERLCTCARVCRVWHAAAVAATRKVELLGCTQRKCSALEPWLCTRATAVDSITIAARFDSRILAADAWLNTPESTWRMPELQLPYQRLAGLTKLSMKLLKCPLAAAAVNMQLPPPGLQSSSASGGGSSKAPASLTALTTLRELSVIDCIINLHGLPALTALERLELSQGWAAPQGNRTGTAPPAFSTISGDIAGAALPHLTRLTHLSLAGSCCCAEAFLHIRHLEHLQELILGWAELPRPVVAGCEALTVGIILDTNTMPGLSNLTRLEKLVIAGAVEAVDASLLQGLPVCLQHLQVDDCRLVVTLGQSRLAMLAGYTQLQHLSINNKRGPLSFLSAEDCTALTASNKLTYLGLTGCQMPADGCSHMFSAECQLPFLTKLEAAPSLLSDPAAVPLISICCPRLSSLIIQLPSAANQRLVGPVNLSGLQQVVGLTQLVLTGVTVAGSSGFRALGQLTGLQELVISAIRGFRLADVMQLTSCKALQYVKLMHMQLTDVLAASLCLNHQGHDGRAPNVWLQLPPALLKQALWLFPFRSMPAADEIQQVTELINALQMHHLEEPSSCEQLTSLQQLIISLALALLQLQQQRKAVAAAGRGPHVPHAPLLQQLQLQTQHLRDVLMKRISDLHECIKDPQLLNRLQTGVPAQGYDFKQAMALGGGAAPAAAAAPQRYPLLSTGVMGPTHVSGLSGLSVLQQQLQMLEAAQMGLGSTGSIAQVLLQQGQQFPLHALNASGLAGFNTPGALWGQMLPQSQQQQPCSLPVNWGPGSPGVLNTHLQAAECSTPAAILPLLQQQQQQQAQAAAAAANTLAQLLSPQTRQSSTAPPGLAQPPDLSVPPGLTPTSKPKQLPPVQQQQTQPQAQQQAQVQTQQPFLAPNEIPQLLTARQQSNASGGGADLNSSLLLQLEHQVQLQQAQQQALNALPTDLLTQVLPQQLNQSALDLLQLQQQQQAQPCPQPQQLQQQLLHLQALAGLQNSMGGLVLLP